jgi:hypothetical protein
MLLFLTKTKNRNPQFLSGVWYQREEGGCKEKHGRLNMVEILCNHV